VSAADERLLSASDDEDLQRAPSATIGDAIRHIVRAAEILEPTDINNRIELVA
jgi:hypothetical protein